MSRGGLVCLAFSLAFTLASGCSYARTLNEFDSAAGWDTSAEPARVSWSPAPEQYSWYSWWGDPTPYEEDNPSGFARERLEDLVEWMGDDLGRIGPVARRLLWVADKDPNGFNRVAAIRGLQTVTRRVGIDLLDAASYYVEPTVAEAAQYQKELFASHAKLEAFLKRARTAPLTAAQRDEYVAALQLYVARAQPQAAWRRLQIRVVWSVMTAERDAAVVAAAAAALRRALAYAVCNGLQSALVPLGEEDLPAVRREALSVYRRIGGIPALPFVLKRMTRPGMSRAYDRDPGVRMTLVRLCAQLQYEHATRGTPRPIEFLYETAVDEEEEPDVRDVALEGLLRCLYKELGSPRVDGGLPWAKEWWKSYVSTRGSK